MGASTPMAERLDRLGFGLSLAGMAVGLTLFAAHTIANPNVTWDEAGQFWMTQGQAFGTPWGTPPGSLADGLYLGRHGNILDPIGFTALLWAWIEAFGAAPATLRALPFLFFLVTVVASYLVGRRAMDLPRTVSLVIPFAILTTYVSLQWATEIRPYSIELCGVVVTALLTLMYLRRPTWGWMLSLAAGIAFFSIFTRYSFAIFAGASLATILLVLWRSGRLRSCLKQWVAGVLVLGATSIFLAWNLGFFDSGDQVWDNYGDPIRVNSVTDFLHMRMLLQINFLYGWHKLTGAFLVLGLVAWLMLRWGSNSESGVAGEIRTRSEQWLPAWLLVGIYEVGSAFASQMGWSQWNSEFRHSIGLIGAAIISGLGLLVLGRAFLTSTWVRTTRNSDSAGVRVVRLLGWVFTTAVLAVLLLSSLNTYASFRRTDVETLGYSVPTKVASAVASVPNVRWVIDTQLFPSLRYLVEASGVPLGNLAITNAVAFGEYGHNDGKLLAWMSEAGICLPGQTTVALVANSAEKNASVYGALAPLVEGGGCTLEVVPLSAVESMVIVK